MDTAQPKLFIGLDIHKRSWRIQLATDLFSGKGMTIPPDPSGLIEYVVCHYQGHEVSIAYEAGCCGYRAHRAFEAQGWKSFVVNPADVSRTGRSQYQKTDKIDAALLCRELRDGRLKSITVPEVEREHFRCLFRRRNDLMKDLRRIKSRIKSQLLFLGKEIPEAYDNANWSKGFVEWMRGLNFRHYTAEAALESQLEQYEHIWSQVKYVSNGLRAYCRDNHTSDYKLLRSVPGIGPMVACGILAELGDLRRFSNIKELVAYVGIMPGIHQSGDKMPRSRGINPRGNRIMRSYFVEASWQALRTDPVMQAYWRTHKGKDPKAILIKVARKLLCRTYAVLKTNTPYQIGVIQ